MSILFRHKLKIFLLITVLALGGIGLVVGTEPVASQTSNQPSAWQKRCNEKNPGVCEIYWRSVLPETGQRIAEFAIGFPESKDKGRGAMVLPLGILLTEDIQMQIDDGLSFKFKVKYCDAGGCVAYLNLGQQALDALRKGNQATVKLKSAKEQNIIIEIPLNGFKKTLETLS